MEATQIAIPTIGQAWPEQGGIYIGSRLIEGVVHHVVMQGGVDTDLVDIEFGKLESAVTDRGSVNGHADWRAPDQAEMMLAYINVKDQFDKDSCYWTSSPYGSVNAWAVDFESGNVCYWRRYDEFRVRPVRSIIA